MRVKQTETEIDLDGEGNLTFVRNAQCGIRADVLDAIGETDNLDEWKAKAEVCGIRFGTFGNEPPPLSFLRCFGLVLGTAAGLLVSLALERAAIHLTVDSSRRLGLDCRHAKLKLKRRRY